MMPAVGNLKDFGFDLRELMQSGPMIQARHKIIEDRRPNCWTPCEATSIRILVPQHQLVTRIGGFVLGWHFRK
jgi:hypothetical protein